MGVVIVTGASKGIGLAIVKSLLEKNATVVGVSRSPAPLKHDRFSYVTGDITDEAVGHQVVKLAESQGKISGLVLNAGVLDPVSRLENAQLIVGLLSKTIPHLRQGGRVVAVSSGASTSSYTSWGAYGASKAALNHIIQTLSVEEPSIFAVSVGPGVVDTAMQGNIRENHAEAMQNDHAKFIKLYETGALLKPEVPGSVIANLALTGKGDINGKYLRYNDEKLAEYA